MHKNNVTDFSRCFFFVTHCSYHFLDLFSFYVTVFLKACRVRDVISNEYRKLHIQGVPIIYYTKSMFSCYGNKRCRMNLIIPVGM